MEKEKHQRIKLATYHIAHFAHGNAWLEWKCANDKIADVISVDEDGRVWIWECKSDWREDYRWPAWAKYGNAADFVVVVAPFVEAANMSDRRPLVGWQDTFDACGVVGLIDGAPRWIRRPYEPRRSNTWRPSEFQRLCKVYEEIERF